jgi:hypothetical protein
MALHASLCGRRSSYPISRLHVASKQASVTDAARGKKGEKGIHYNEMIRGYKE